MLTTNKTSHYDTNAAATSTAAYISLKTVYFVLSLIVLFTITTIGLAAAALAVGIKNMSKINDLGPSSISSSTTVATSVASTVATSLQNSITAEQMLGHLAQLQRIADSSGGTRAIGTAGFNLTLNYITDYLSQFSNLEVKQEFFNVSTWRLLRVPVFLSYINGVEVNYTWGPAQDFYHMTYSRPADFSTPVRLTIIPRLGCDDSDWSAALPYAAAGSIALVIRGECTFVEKVNLAAKYNAAGILIYNDGTAPDRFTPVIATAGPNATFPALGLSYQLGTILVQAAQNTSTNASVRITIVAQYVPNTVVGNICAHTVTGDATQTIVIGSHSDSVPEGPGINDNGSGSAANLVLAANLARLLQTSTYPVYPYRVKFCWWGAEEVGLLGSAYHADVAKSSTVLGERIEAVRLERQNYLVNLNYDMLGSPNYIFGIYDGTTANRNTTPANAIPGSIRLSELYRDWFINQSLPWTYTEFSGRSDYGPFLAAGVVASGLFSGGDDTKTKEERDYYDRLLGQGQGGIASAIHDPCYHQTCDSMANINPFAYEKMVKAAAYVLEYLGRLPDLKTWLYPAPQIKELEKALPNKLLQKKVNA
ncbi:unnamed protein product, partial [Didymodactylos carnosus]